MLINGVIDELWHYHEHSAKVGVLRNGVSWYTINEGEREGVHEGYLLLLGVKTLFGFGAGWQFLLN